MVWRPADRAQRIPRSARPNSILRPKGSTFFFPKGKRFRPHHLFFTKRDGAAWRYQRKIVGARMPVVLAEAEMRPDTPRSLS